MPCIDYKYRNGLKEGLANMGKIKTLSGLNQGPPPLLSDYGKCYVLEENMNYFWRVSYHIENYYDFQFL